ncbi:MAG TPA: histidine--tRNA ligase, partial [Firmicutes bacterium]|nr:histidine--tRNA ligase [Bacillota bacterium]
QQCGGEAMPGIGFGMGIERVMLALEKQGLLTQGAKPLALFLAGMGDAACNAAFALLRKARAAGLAAEMDYMDRSLKAQMKYAAKIPARFVAILGEEELAEQVVSLRNMNSGEQTKVPFEKLIETMLGKQEEE